MKKSNRPYYFLLFFICHELLVAAFYFENYLGLDPCPLCMVSRVTVFALGLLFLIAALHNPSGLTRKVYHSAMSLVSLLGVLVSGRHIYLQSLPADEVPVCGPGLDYMLDTLPFSDVLKEVMHGSGECAEVSWEFLSLSMPIWMLIIYAGFLIISILPVIQKQHRFHFTGKD